ncbi:MAG TPA: flagellar motor protein MotB [Candidatus Dormibacteraeota bacterium]|nr:flagellar motor protein MotB [Candidatus Dormibacteraeota bacterium]
MANSNPPPIIIKKKVSHGGHHGGAWKVAYADFVTAMMALFIVLWLMNTSKPIQEAVSGYFRDPSGTSKKVGSDIAGPAAKTAASSKEDMQELKKQLEKAISEMPDFDKIKKHIDITITSEGLRIELTESAKGTFFDSGSAKITGDGQEIISTLAQQIGKLPNKLAIEGHTDSVPYGPGASYTNWELSSDRANAARRLLQTHDVRPDQVTQVRGFADQRLRLRENPKDPANRRISIIVLYLTKEGKDKIDKPDSAAADGSKAGETEEKSKE